jgi:hypothetical protein
MVGSSVQKKCQAPDPYDGDFYDENPYDIPIPLFPHEANYDRPEVYEKDCPGNS